MSTLWTPGGEVPVGGRPGVGYQAETDPTDEVPDSAAGSDETEFDLDSLSPEDREHAEEYIRQMAEARERLKQTPAEAVVANHAMGLYELAALHLTSQPPNLSAATVAIDALGALLDGMQGRLGEPEATLREGLSQIRMAFVQLKNRPDDPGDDSDDRQPSADPAA